MQIAVFGIDLGKNVCSVVGLDATGRVVLRRRLRTLLIHGARAALPSLSRSAGPLGSWLRELTARAHVNTVVVALANKLARIAWAVLRSGRLFDGAVARG